MSKLILLDAGPLGLLSNPNSTPSAHAAHTWMYQQQSQGHVLIVPEIADYEVRRELLRAGKSKGIRRLELLKATLSYLPLTTKTMLRAAEFWAQSRRTGRPTASDAALDCDVILAAQAALLLDAGGDAIIATTNLRHLSQFVPAADWQQL